MESEKKKKIIFLVIVILVVLGLILVFWKTSNQGPKVAKNSNEPLKIETPSAGFEYRPEAVPAQSETEFSVVNLAKNYAARFGSWSTDNPGFNLEELKPLSTAKMQTYLQNLAIDYQAKEFQGLSTQSISAKILSLDDEQAKVLVNTQRVETKSDLTNRTYYQDIEMTLAKAGEKWLVSAAYWK